MLIAGRVSRISIIAPVVIPKRCTMFKAQSVFVLMTASQVYTCKTMMSTLTESYYEPRFANLVTPYAGNARSKRRTAQVAKQKQLEVSFITTIKMSRRILATVSRTVPMDTEPRKRYVSVALIKD